jgi:hypothetical protein
MARIASTQPKFGVIGATGRRFSRHGKARPVSVATSDLCAVDSIVRGYLTRTRTLYSIHETLWALPEKWRRPQINFDDLLLCVAMSTRGWGCYVYRPSYDAEKLIGTELPDEFALWRHREHEAERSAFLKMVRRRLGWKPLCEQKLASQTRSLRKHSSTSPHAIPRNRTDLLNWFIKIFGFVSYLEIGLGNGKNFRRVNCAHKESVDPAEGSECLTQPTHQMTSDAFFAQNRRRYDLIFIDGLHHEENVTRDIKNSLQCLTAQGIVVCHDLNPRTELLQKVPRQSKAWTGDCWKAWVRLRQESNGAQMAVADLETGIGIIYPAGKTKNITLPLLPALTWELFERNRQEWLNLVPINNLQTLILQSAGGNR